MTERVIVANSIPLDGDGNPVLTITGTLESGSVSTDSGAISFKAATDAGAELSAANDGRYGFSVQNTSPSYLYVCLGEAAATDHYTIRLPQWGYYERDGYRGLVTGIWDTGASSGGAMVTELVNGA